MSIKDGPGEGTWSVFAQKVVEQRDAAREENTNLRETIEGVSRSLAATVNGWAYEHEPVLGVSQALKLACDTIEDLRAGRYAPIAGRGVSRAQYDEALNAIVAGDKRLEAATARAEKAEAREKAIGDELEKATDRIEGLVKENERFRHAAAETADLLMRGALEDDLSSAQQMVEELRAVLVRRHAHDVAGGICDTPERCSCDDDVTAILEQAAPIAGRWCLASERDAAIADAAAVMSSIYESFRDGEKIDRAVVDIGIGCWLEKHAPGSLPEKDAVVPEEAQLLAELERLSAGVSTGDSAHRMEQILQRLLEIEQAGALAIDREHERRMQDLDSTMEGLGLATRVIFEPWEHDEIKRLRASIADAAAVMESIYESFRDGERIDRAVVDIGIGCWLEKHAPDSLQGKDGD